MRVSSGSYLGNSQSGRALDLGGVPSLFVVGRGSTQKMVRTTTVTGDACKRFATATALTGMTGRITATTADGYTLGNTTEINASGSTYHWWAIHDNSNDDVATGSYTGTGTSSSQSVTLPFGADGQTALLMILPAESRLVAYRLGSMTGDGALEEGGATGYRTGWVTACSGTGFTVSSTLNVVSEVYHWVAVKASSLLATATWTGTAAERTISGLAFTPDSALVKRQGSTPSAWRNASHTGTVSSSLAATADMNDAILGFSSNAALLGANVAANDTGTYHGLFIRAGFTGNAPPVVQPPGTYRLAGSYRLATASQRRIALGAPELADPIRIATGGATADTRAPVFSAGPTTGTITTTGWPVSFTSDEAATYKVFRYLTSAGRASAVQVATGAASATGAVSVGVVVPSSATSTSYTYYVTLTDAANNTRPSSDIAVTVPGTGSGTPTTDTTPPVISSVVASTPSTSGVSISWTTNEAASSQVKYWPFNADAPDGGESNSISTVLQSALSTSHLQGVAGLTGATTYGYRVISTDASGNTAASDPAGSFTTATPITDTLSQMDMGDLTIDATFNSISFFWPYAGDADNNATCTGRFKVHSEADQDWNIVGGGWRAMLPLWRNFEGVHYLTFTRKMFMGSILKLDDNTSYDWELTVRDGGETFVYAGTTSTQHDNLPDAYASTTTHYVDPVNGNDTLTGTSSTVPVGVTPSTIATAGTVGPWRTLSKVIKMANAATSDMVVEFLPGHLISPSINTNSLFLKPPDGVRVHLRAKYPAVDTDMHDQTAFGTPGRSLMNVGNWTYIEPRATDAGPLMAGPTGATDPDLQVGATWREATSTTGTTAKTITANRIAPWVLTDVVDRYGVTRQLWKWSNFPSLTANPGLVKYQMFYCATRDEAMPMRCASWMYEPKGLMFGGTNASTPPNNDIAHAPHGNVAEWAAKIQYDARYRYGTYYDLATDAMYLRMPYDLDPNDFYWWIGTLPALIITAPDVRITGFCWTGHLQAINANETCHRLVVDRNYMRSAVNQVYTGAKAPTSKSPTFAQAEDILIQHNRFQDSGLNNANTAEHDEFYPLPWTSIKDYEKPLHPDELGFVAGDGGARRRIVRWNTGLGGFDFVSVYAANFRDPSATFANMATEVYENYADGMTDDFCDLSWNQINVKVYRNMVRNGEVGVSPAPAYPGIIYVFENLWADMGNHHLGVAKYYYDPTTLLWKWESYSRTYGPYDGHLETGQYIGRRGPAGYWDKHSGGSYDTLLVVRVNETYWTDNADNVDPLNATEGLPGGWINAGGGKENLPSFYFRNNVVRVLRKVCANVPMCVSAKPTDPYTTVKVIVPFQVDSDYNDWSTSYEEDGRGTLTFAMEWDDGVNDNTLANWRSRLAAVSDRPGQGVNDNTSRPGVTTFLVTPDPSVEFVDRAGGDWRPDPSGHFWRTGTPVPNIADREGIDFTTKPHRGWPGDQK